MRAVMPHDAANALLNLFPHLAQVPGAGSKYYDATDVQSFHAALEIVKCIPDELFTVDSMTYALLLTILFRLDAQAQQWMRFPNAGRVYFHADKDPLRNLFNVLRALPDRYPSKSPERLLFITDAELRESLGSDIEEVERALRNSEWKAATVLAGSTIEALLLWRLNQDPEAARRTTAPKGVARKPDLNRWELHQLITAAAELALISSDTALAAGLAKDFRNLIHPGRVQRLGQSCNRGTAYSAVAALEHVTDDLADG